MSWLRRKKPPATDVQYHPLPRKPNPVRYGIECAAYSQLGMNAIAHLPCWACGHNGCTPGYPCDSCAITVRLNQLEEAWRPGPTTGRHQLS